MGNKIILSADSTCDIGPEMQQRYNVQLFHAQILLGGKTCHDGVDIWPDDLYRAWREEGLLPRTSAIMPVQYEEKFSQWVAQGCDVVHISLGTGITSSYQNACHIAEEMGHVYPVDSASLSTGFGLLVVKAGEMIEAGMAAPDIQKALGEMNRRTNASFVLDTLEFMRAGGRCSAVAAFGANLLQLKPGIRVDNHSGGKMSVGKKYRGAMERVLPEYVKDQLGGCGDLELEHVFITHSGSPDSDIELVRQEIARYAEFRQVHVTRASCTISAHCGPRTLGVLFMTK